MMSLSRSLPSSRAALPALAGVIACAALTACGGGGTSASSSSCSVIAASGGTTASNTINPSLSGTPGFISSFGSSSSHDGGTPEYGQLVQIGNYFYGTTAYGGANGQGAVIRVDTSGAETVIYSFGSQSGDGSTPLAGLTLGQDGKLYGTTYAGGAHGNGAVFVIDLSATPIETTLYSFNTGTDGQSPQGGLIETSAGHFFGTTKYGGANNAGTVFALTTDGTAGGTTVSLLYNFGASTTDAKNPQATLVRATDGSLYGTAYYGGAYGNGAVFKVDGCGTESLVYSFSAAGTDGAHPLGGLIQGADGALYGTTTAGGAHATVPQEVLGTVFKLTLSGTESVVYSFGASASDGTQPQSTLVQDSNGNLYGTTTGGGAHASSGSGGTIFEIPADPSTKLPTAIPSTGTAPIVYSFAASSSDGNYPIGGLTIGSDGYLYGTTSAGGSNGNGTVFQIK